MHKHLCTMALFYSYKSKFMMAEGLFREAIEHMGTKANIHPMLKVEAQLMFGHTLIKVPKRKNEAQKIIDEATGDRADLL